MSEIDAVIQIAKKTILFDCVTTCDGHRLWHRMLRVVHNVEHIINLEDLAEADVPIDRFSLVVAAYFSDVCFAHKDNPMTQTPRPSQSKTSLEVSAQIAAQKLSSVLSKAQKINVGNIITESSNRFTQMTEAMILSDARNLDDMGAVGIFSELGILLSQGKNPSELLNAWQRKVDYRYWDARLKENFRFSSVRQLAQQRFDSVANFMNQLGVEISASDIKELTAARLNV
ncbi:MAG: hypothetical protein GWO86_01025 [Planctomycetes bacterium]|nr:hypothetical protein [Planctomycetota bacterium]